MIMDIRWLYAALQVTSDGWNLPFGGLHVQ
jgi:hypothetical protein